MSGFSPFLMMRVCVNQGAYTSAAASPEVHARLLSLGMRNVAEVPRAPVKRREVPEISAQSARDKRQS
jgi:hypothetical protein